MKRLLSLVAIMALVATLLPGTGVAGLRGAFDPIGRGDLPSLVDEIPYGNGLSNGQQTPSIRPQPVGAGNGVALLERWFSFTTRSSVVGHETSRSIWQGLNRTSAPLTVSFIADARRPLLIDPTGEISYADPSWSPNGRFLAYIKTNSPVTEAAIYVQEYLVSTNMTTSTTPVGAPILVVASSDQVRNRRPDWSPNGNSLAFDSDVSGTSVDIYTVQVFPSVGVPVKHTFVANRNELNPSWAPDGHRIAYDTNRFGASIIEIVDITNNDNVTLAETNFAAITHANPDWSSDGASIYYEAPQNEDAQSNPDIWKLDLATQAKCAIHLDGGGDNAVSISPFQNLTNDGIPYNNIYMESQGGPFGLITWRTNPVQNCFAPLPLNASISPPSFNIGSGGQDLSLSMSFPPETQAAGYICSDFNAEGREGVRMRTSIIASPTLLGLAAQVNPRTGLPYYSATGGPNGSGAEQITTKFTRRSVESRLVALGLVNQTVPAEVTAYSNVVGRTFRGFAYIRVNASGAGSIVRLEQNSPNPFNPVTTIKFASSKPGNISLRVYNVRGELVKTIVDQHYEAGQHQATWDGRNSAGNHVSSGVYYAKVSSVGGSADVLKMVMAK